MVANFDQQLFALHSSEIDYLDFWWPAMDDADAENMNRRVKKITCPHSYFSNEKKMVYLGKLASLSTGRSAALDKVKSLARFSTNRLFNTSKATKADSSAINIETIDTDRVTEWTATPIKFNNITPEIFEQPKFVFR